MTVLQITPLRVSISLMMLTLKSPGYVGSEAGLGAIVLLVLQHGIPLTHSPLFPTLFYLAPGDKKLYSTALLLSDHVPLNTSVHFIPFPALVFQHVG